MFHFGIQMWARLVLANALMSCNFCFRCAMLKHSFNYFVNFHLNYFLSSAVTVLQALTTLYISFKIYYSTKYKHRFNYTSWYNWFIIIIFWTWKFIGTLYWQAGSQKCFGLTNWLAISVFDPLYKGIANKMETYDNSVENCRKGQLN